MHIAHLQSFELRNKNHRNKDKVNFYKVKGKILEKERKSSSRNGETPKSGSKPKSFEQRN